MTVSLAPQFFLRKNVTAATNTHAKIVGRVVFSALRFASRKMSDKFFPELPFYMLYMHIYFNFKSNVYFALSRV
jgi:hypothetical protein